MTGSGRIDRLSGLPSRCLGGSGQQRHRPREAARKFAADARRTFASARDRARPCETIGDTRWTTHINCGTRSAPSTRLTSNSSESAASLAHGANTLTQDVDFAYAVDDDDLTKLADFLVAIHSRIITRKTDHGFPISPGLLRRVHFLNLATDIRAVDVMREIPGADSFAGLRVRAVSMDFGGFPVNVASLDDLIQMKQAANRPKDQLHLLEQFALRTQIIEGH
jgi:hypothetical protein